MNIGKEYTIALTCHTKIKPMILFKAKKLTYVNLGQMNAKGMCEKNQQETGKMSTSS